MKELLRTVWTWGEMVKFSHSVFALPFALFSAFLAARPGRPSAGQLVLIVLAMVAARSAAMTFNRIADFKQDCANPRTALRPLQRGSIRLRSAWVFLAISCAGFLVACGGFWHFYANPWPLRLALPVLAVLLLYSYAKRWTRFTHLALGAAIGLSAVAAWIAIRPEVPQLPAWLLMLAVLFWIGGFDVIYACQDVEFDRRFGLRSLPAALGIGAALRLVRLFHVLTVLALIGVGVTAKLGALYLVGVAAVAVLLVIENSLVSPDDLGRINVAFFAVNGFVSLIMAFLGMLDVLL